MIHKGFEGTLNKNMENLPSLNPAFEAGFFIVTIHSIFDNYHLILAANILLANFQNLITLLLWIC